MNTLIAIMCVVSLIGVLTCLMCIYQSREIARQDVRLKIQYDMRFCYALALQSIHRVSLEAIIETNYATSPRPIATHYLEIIETMCDKTLKQGA